MRASRAGKPHQDRTRLLFPAGVTGFAGRIDRSIAANGAVRHLHKHMTSIARDFAMRTLQRKSGIDIVIETKRRPCDRRVTHFTRFGWLAPAKLSHMHIFMAAAAGCLRKDESPYLCSVFGSRHSVAAHTGGGEVGALQRKARLVMFCNAEQCRDEAFFMMAAFTAPTVRAPLELTGMNIGVTIAALRRLQRQEHIAGRMTFNAINAVVQTAQRESGFGVIKIRPFEPLPAAFVMAGPAIAAEFALVHVSMARCTRVERQWPEPVSALVALDTLNLLVFSE